MPDQHDFTLPSMTAAAALAEARAGAILVDIRKPQARAASGQAIAGAELRDPFAFAHDDPLTSTDRPIIAFCVHGHEVSQFACALLMLHGRKASYVAGGFAALVSAGAPLDELAR